MKPLIVKSGQAPTIQRVPPQSFATCLTEALYVINKSNSRPFRRTGIKGVGSLQLQVLHILARAPETPLSLSDIATACAVRMPTVSGVVAKLKAQSLVTQHSSSVDRRARLTRLTAAGARLVIRTPDTWAGQVKHGIETLSRTEQQQVAQSLSAFFPPIDRTNSIHPSSHNRERS